MILSGAAHGVILQHAPKRKFFEDFESLGCTLPPIDEEIALVRLLGAPVWAVSLYTGGLSYDEAKTEQASLQRQLNLPVVLPLEEGADSLAALLQEKL